MIGTVYVHSSLKKALALLLTVVQSSSPLETELMIRPADKIVVALSFPRHYKHKYLMCTLSNEWICKYAYEALISTHSNCHLKSKMKLCFLQTRFYCTLSLTCMMLDLHASSLTGYFMFTNEQIIGITSIWLAFKVTVR